MNFPLSVFFMSITFSIALPLVDMFTDWYLFHNTMTFKGNSVAMAACRTCYRKGTENYEDRQRSQSKCDVCVSSKRKRSDGMGGIHCGLSSSSLDTMTELLKEHSCLPNGTVWTMRNYGPRNITIRQSNACEVSDRCCITTPPRDRDHSAKNDMNQHLPDSTNWFRCVKYNGYGGKCEYCVGVGTSDLDSCAELARNDVAFLRDKLLDCNDGYYTASKSGKRFEQNNNGCAKEDECCIHVRSNQSLFSVGDDNYHRCNNPCRLHINYLSLVSKAIHNWTSWSDQSEYHGDQLVGGKTCNTSITFGYCLLIPIFLNWLFALKVWSSDLKQKMTGKKTFIFGITGTYPLFLVLKYLYNWKNKEVMNQQKERFERDVATAEGYLESILQVSYYLHINLILRH